MIIVKMMGQLGNQLFIYAMARALQKEYGGKIYLDLSGLKRHYYTAQYKLQEYNLPEDIISYDMTEIDSKTLKRYEWYSRLFHIEQKIQRVLLSNKQTSDKMIARWFNRGCYFNFNRNWYNYPTSSAQTKIVYGYFQSEKYFDSVKQELLNDLQLVSTLTESDHLFLNSIRASDSVGVSIRMINNFKNVQAFISKEYYISGMKYLAETHSDLKFFVFADDIQAVKNEIVFPFNVEYVEPSSSVIGLFLLSNCKHFVLANSTFSWWGAYLSNCDGKEIVMPDPWDKVGQYREDIYFKDCIRIPCKFSEVITE